MAAADLTATRLRELLHYSPETGEFTRLSSRGRPDLVGQKAGHLEKSKGYVVVWVDGKAYKAHRLAWLYVHGVWPKYDVDHRNGEKENNRISNLRVATSSENMQNLLRAHTKSKCGLLGVFWNPQRNKWVAKIKAKGFNHHLGTFPTAEEASAAYLAAKRQLHPFSTL